MAEVYELSYGWASPVLAYIMSVLGCLLGIMLATRAQADAGRRRVRLLLYASLAIGGTGVWQAHIIAILGFAVPYSVPRYDPFLVGASLAVAVAVVGCGLFVAGFGSPRFVRLLLAGALIGAGIAATHYTAMGAVRVGGDVTYEPVGFVASVAIAMAVACAALWFIGTLRGLRSAIVASFVMAAAVVGMHYVSMSAVRIHLDPAGGDIPPFEGASSILLIPIVVLIGAVAIAMLWFFTVGTSTVHDLRAIFESPDRKVEIEPWMIDEVTSRIAIEPGPVGAEESTTPGARAITAGPAHTARPAPAITPVWLNVPVWGPTNRPIEVVPYTESARRNGGARAALALAYPNAPGATPFPGATPIPGATPFPGATPIPDVPDRYPPTVNPDPVPTVQVNNRRATRRNRRHI